MPLPRHLFVSAFRHQRMGWFFALLVGIMVYVATFAMAAEATLSAITFRWDQGMENRMTVEIPLATDESSTPQTERVREVLSVLHIMPDIATITVIPDNETEKLLKPWIKQPDLLKVLPVPTLIDIERKGDSRLTSTEVEDHVKAVIKGAQVDSHATWIGDMRHLIYGLTAIAALMILLTGAALIIAVSLLCRAIMATECDTVSLLHIMGAEDIDIARHFQSIAQHLSWPASFVGFSLALLSLGILLYFLRHFADPALLSPFHWTALGIATGMVPVMATGIAALSARTAALTLLQTMP
jgi:cell division transport system permease protein